MSFISTRNVLKLKNSEGIGGGGGGGGGGEESCQKHFCGQNPFQHIVTYFLQVTVFSYVYTIISCIFLLQEKSPVKKNVSVSKISFHILSLFFASNCVQLCLHNYKLYFLVTGRVWNIQINDMCTVKSSMPSREIKGNKSFILMQCHYS